MNNTPLNHNPEPYTLNKDEEGKGGKGKGKGKGALEKKEAVEAVEEGTPESLRH